MEDQVASITSMGISAVYISDKETSDHTVKIKVRNGEYQLIFMSPEPFFQVWNGGERSALIYTEQIWLRL